MTRAVESLVYAYRNGVKFRELKAVSAPNINANATAAIKTSFSGAFLHDDTVDWLADDIRPFLTIDGTEYPLGVFRAASVSESRNSTGKVDTISAYDRCYQLQCNRTAAMLHLAAGANYTATIQSMLETCGIELMSVTPSANALQTDREDWEIGTDYLTIINALLAEINYSDVWFDCNGYAIIKPKPEPSAGSIRHTYSSGADCSLLSRDYTRETDAFNTPNVFTVVCSNPDLESVLTATAENNNTTSALSIPRRGMRIVQIYKVDNTASQTELDAYAANLCYESMLGGETVSITTALMPNHGIGDIVALNHDGIQGIYAERNWSMTLKAGGSMRHTLRRVIYDG